ncbi:hypothetical protein N7474_006840 [Penicillium riverlandense]|uniref:uncharacterized protein n=1 Tax=Penicillium riverlandense TaxID=1903569 RepID=UPI002546782E|nr:uncharacterized protein N7474_006840 [Penicillium riverlandense]KAJ5815063.1 hypothetical protein N7474_006840 [Penicillium riverlandense]
MAVRLEKLLNSSAFVFLSAILFCLILLTPADAIYQCYVTKRLENIFFITGAYVITFALAVLIYATRIYTNRNTLTGIPKAWIPVEKEDVSKSVRRLVMEGLARSSVISYQARPRDTSSDEDSFANYKPLVIDSKHPPWGAIEHPGWSSPASPDLPDLPYHTVIRELPNLIEAKAVSLAPADMVHDNPELFGPSSSIGNQSIPDTRVVEALQRPASLGLREYIHHLTALQIIQPDLGAEFLRLYERARFSSRALHETEFRDLMHTFAEVLRGMTPLEPPMLDEIRDSVSYRRPGSESVIGPSDEEGYTDTVNHNGYDGAYGSMRSDSLRSSNASTWDTRSQSRYETAQAVNTPASVASPSRGSFRPPALPLTPSSRSLRRVQSGQSGSSGGSVVRLAQPRVSADLPYTIDFRRNG